MFVPFKLLLLPLIIYLKVIPGQIHKDVSLRLFITALWIGKEKENNLKSLYMGISK